MKLFTPAIFLPAVCLLCAIVAMALGSAYTVSATLGIAFLTIGATMGVNPALICGAVKVMEFAQRMIAEKQMQIRRQKQAEKARLYVLLFFKYAAYEEVIFRYTGTVRPQNIESEAVFNHLYGKHPEGFKCVAHFIRMNARVTTEACTLFAQCAFLCSKGFAAGARRPAHRLFEKENRQNASGRRLKGKNHTQMFGSCSRIV